MTEEQKAKIQEAKRATADKCKDWRAAAIPVGAFRVFRLDEDNWVVEKRDKPGEYRYYAHAAEALQVAVRLDVGEHKDIKSMLAQLDRIDESIAGAARFAG